VWRGSARLVVSKAKFRMRSTSCGSGYAAADRPVTPPKRRATRTVDDTVLPDGTSSTYKFVLKKSARLVKQLSENSIQIGGMAPDFVTVQVRKEDTGVLVKRTVYVSDQNGTKTLDLYSGWNPQTQKHKLPLLALPMKVCQLVTLERLWVSHNKLSTLPPELENLIVLRELFIHKNNFEEIPECVCKLPSLEVLWFSNNRISVVPDMVSQMIALKRLHLDYNLISYFPSSVCALKGLEVLYLNNNVIHQICENVGNMTKLKRFYLHHNKINEIPIGITKLISIELLKLDNNEIRSIKREFKQFKSIKTGAGAIISLESNPFVTPESKTKLSLAGIVPSSSQPLRTRRYSDQFEREAARRPIRVSLPMTSETAERIVEYKADTLPRPKSSSLVQQHRPTSNEH